MFGHQNIESIQIPVMSAMMQIHRNYPCVSEHSGCLTAGSVDVYT